VKELEDFFAANELSPAKVIALFTSVLISQLREVLNKILGFWWKLIIGVLIFSWRKTSLSVLSTYWNHRLRPESMTGLEYRMIYRQNRIIH